jgi:hypothetical protein
LKRAPIITGIVLLLVTLPWTIPRVQTWGYSGPDAESVYAELNAKLSPGDSEERIQDVLTQLDIGFAFNEFRNRYEGTVRSSRRSVPAPGYFPGSMKCVTAVEVYVDGHRHYLRCEVTDVGTFL